MVLRNFISKKVGFANNKAHKKAIKTWRKAGASRALLMLFRSFYGFCLYVACFRDYSGYIEPALGKMDDFGDNNRRGLICFDEKQGYSNTVCRKWQPILNLKTVIKQD
jgi:hypothetical protein